MGVTISGMTGRGSIRHNNRAFSAANIDRSRTELNVTFCQEDLKQVYHQVFDEALEAYNAKKKKTRDKISDYYEHIRQGKQEKLFHEVIFQIGNKDDCGCGTLDGDRAAAVLKEFAERSRLLPNLPRPMSLRSSAWVVVVSTWICQSTGQRPSVLQRPRSR